VSDQGLSGQYAHGGRSGTWALTAFRD